MEKIGPELGLHSQEEPGLDEIYHPLHRPGIIKREKDKLICPGYFLLGRAVSGYRYGREQDFQLGPGLLHFSYDRERSYYLTY
jgi:hypothetical protein